MTNDPLTAIKNRLAKATQGPWHETHPISSDFTKADFDLCLHAPTDLARLIRVVECYERALKDLSSRIGLDAVQVEHETVWGDANNIKAQLEQSIECQRRWFKEMQDLLSEGQRILEET